MLNEMMRSVCYPKTNYEELILWPMKHELSNGIV